MATPDSTIPAGYCQCGCGRRTKIATANNTKRGYTKGQHRFFVVGHGLYRKRDEPDDSPVRTCRTCRVQKTLEEFTRVKGKIVLRCRQCTTARTWTWRQQNPDGKRAYDLKRLFGITIDDYERLFSEQHGVCAICKHAERIIDPRTGELRRLAVDHCHERKQVRGLLCADCNKALGAFQDDPSLLRAAIEYLTKER